MPGLAHNNLAKMALQRLVTCDAAIAGYREDLAVKARLVVARPAQQQRRQPASY